MSHQPMHGWALFAGQIADQAASDQQSGSLTSVGGWVRTPLFWIERRRQRRRLRELADLNDYLLRDIGVSRSEALRESAKPFWR